VKASKSSIGRAVDQPDPNIRLYLLHGPDEAQSRALGARLVEALGASKSGVAGGLLKSDPASLTDEAGAMSLFGGKRVVWVEPANDDVAAAVTALLEAGSIESPVVVIAGALRKTSALLKLAEGSAQAVAFASYPPEGADAQRMVVDVARRFGLKMAPEIASRIAEAAGNDQAIVGQELQKLALYVDASPESPRNLDAGALEAVGAEVEEGDHSRLADLALAGEVQELADELIALPSSAEGIPVIRALQRRLLQIAPVRARVDRGERVDAVMASASKSLFWRDKGVVQRLIGLWDSQRLATVAGRVGKLERDLLFSRAPAHEALGEELLAIARAARRR
jgi:DNA polymerase-3 subunit delta